MKIGPRYKIARRLGAEVFDKTQTAKFSASMQRRKKLPSRPKSEFGTQLLDKQKARFTYGLNERQFANAVKAAIADKKTKSDQKLYQLLEMRLDNVIYRLGLANSRAFARQLASHGHVVVNNVRVTIPSYHVKVGDVVTIREGSKKKRPFTDLANKLKEASVPVWLQFDPASYRGEVKALPQYVRTEAQIDLPVILEFYQR